MIKFRLLLAALVLVLPLLVLGCEGDSGKAEENQPKTTADQAAEKEKVPAKEEKKVTDEAKEISIKVYYPNDKGTRLMAAARKVTTTEDKKYETALLSLLEGTKAKGETTIIPRQTKLNGVTVKDGTATVDFSADMVKYFVGGSTGEEMLVGSVVNTLTEFSEVRRVLILVDGKTLETLAGHLDLSEPLERMPKLLK